jgi:hypothetical protein
MKKPNLPQIYPSAARPSLAKSPAFGSPLIDALALSRESSHCFKHSSYKYQKNTLCQYRILDCENYLSAKRSDEMGTLSEVATGGNSCKIV